MNLETVSSPGGDAGVGACSLSSLLSLGCRSRAEAAQSFAKKLQSKLWSITPSSSDGHLSIVGTENLNIGDEHPNEKGSCSEANKSLGVTVEARFDWDSKRVETVVTSAPSVITPSISNSSSKLCTYTSTFQCEPLLTLHQLSVSSESSSPSEDGYATATDSMEQHNNGIPRDGSNERNLQQPHQLYYFKGALMDEWPGDDEQFHQHHHHHRRHHAHQQPFTQHQLKRAAADYTAHAASTGSAPLNDHESDAGSSTSTTTNPFSDSDQYFDFGIETPCDSDSAGEETLSHDPPIVINRDDGLPMQIEGTECGNMFESPSLSDSSSSSSSDSSSSNSDDSSSNDSGDDDDEDEDEDSQDYVTQLTNKEDEESSFYESLSQSPASAGFSSKATNYNCNRFNFNHHEGCTIPSSIAGDGANQSNFPALSNIVPLNIVNNSNESIGLDHLAHDGNTQLLTENEVVVSEDTRAHEELVAGERLSRLATPREQTPRANGSFQGDSEDAGDGGYNDDDCVEREAEIIPGLAPAHSRTPNIPPAVDQVEQLRSKEFEQLHLKEDVIESVDCNQQQQVPSVDLVTHVTTLNVDMVRLAPIIVDQLFNGGSATANVVIAAANNGSSGAHVGTGHVVGTHDLEKYSTADQYTLHNDHRQVVVSKGSFGNDSNLELSNSITFQVNQELNSQDSVKVGSRTGSEHNEQEPTSNKANIINTAAEETKENSEGHCLSLESICLNNVSETNCESDVDDSSSYCSVESRETTTERNDKEQSPASTKTEDGEGDGADSEDSDDPNTRHRVQRSTSLKTGKTPPGTPGRKKIVRFADALGLDLALVRTFLDEVPNVPQSAFSDLSDAPPADPYVSGEAPLTPSYIRVTRRDPNTNNSVTTFFNSPRILVASFAQPGNMPDFLEKVKRQKVCLETATMMDEMRLRGVVRVLNLDFHKTVLIRYTVDEWRTSGDQVATYVPGSCDGLSDRFSFTLSGVQSLNPGQRLIFALCYRVSGQEIWDNYNGRNYIFQCVSNSNYMPSIALHSPNVSETFLPYV